MKAVTILCALAALATAAPFYPISTSSFPPPPPLKTGLAIPTGGFPHLSINATFPSASGCLPPPPHVTGRSPRPHGPAAPYKRTAGHVGYPGPGPGTGIATGTGVPRPGFPFPTGFPNATSHGSLLPTGSDARGFVGSPRYTPKPVKTTASAE